MEFVINSELLQRADGSDDEAQWEGRIFSRARQRRSDERIDLPSMMGERKGQDRGRNV